LSCNYNKLDCTNNAFHEKITAFHTQPRNRQKIRSIFANVEAETRSLKRLERLTGGPPDVRRFSRKTGQKVKNSVYGTTLYKRVKAPTDCPFVVILRP
jgi:hypothetical protein